MPQVPLHAPSSLSPASKTATNPLPPLLHTPSGLAILEIQGSIHFPTFASSATSIGKLVFPLFDPVSSNKDDMKWLKRVYLSIGKHQRLTGEVKKLGKPFAVIRKRGVADTGEESMEGVEDTSGEGGEELEIVEVVKYKIVFSTRPEPVGGEEA